MTSKVDHISDIMTDVLKAEYYVAVGSPTINNQMLPTVASPSSVIRKDLPLKNKSICLRFLWAGVDRAPALSNDGLEACKFQDCHGTGKGAVHSFGSISEGAVRKRLQL